MYAVLGGHVEVVELLVGNIHLDLKEVNSVSYLAVPHYSKKSIPSKLIKSGMTCNCGHSFAAMLVYLFI